MVAGKNDAEGELAPASADAQLLKTPDAASGEE
jgi:hypothetical protein